MPTFNEPSPRPFLKWVGGKRQLLSKLLEAVDAAVPFDDYHEPFLGGGALFFAMARTGRIKKTSFLTDVNENLISAYMGVRDEIEKVIKTLLEHKRKHSEPYFYELRSRMPRTLANRAARIIYLNKTCYNGLYRENSKGLFNAPFGRYKNPRICDSENLRAVSETLKAAQIYATDFTSVAKNANRGDLVYFDPPYTPISKTADFTNYSRDGFNAAAQVKLAELFSELSRKGVKVILSNSMTESTKTLYKNHFIYEVFANRLVNSKSERRGKVPEALITNFPIDENTLDGAKRVNGRAVNAQTNIGLEKLVAKQWLKDNNYDDVAALIDEITKEWKIKGKNTRRSWWEILAGDSRGNPRTVAGREFPVLRAAQIRQGVPITDSALCRNGREQAPPIRVTRRQR